MKILNILMLFSLLVFFNSCEKDFENKNDITNSQVFSTAAGLRGVTVGLAEHFASSTYAPIVEIPGITTREIGITSTYATPRELAEGGTKLPAENVGILRLWARLLRDKGVAEEILANVDDVDMPDAQKAGIRAFAKFFKAMTLGYLIQNFEKAPIDNAPDGNAPFSDRATVLNECISLLSSASADIGGNDVAANFINGLVSSTFDIENVINAYQARYSLFAGKYQEAINAANKVDLTSKSEWTYDGTEHKNPVHQFAVFDNPDTYPTDNFGLVGSLTPEASDGRLSFYLATFDTIGTAETGSWAVDSLVGFFSTETASIPVYLPGEMLLIKAEAYANMPGQLSQAVEQINLVRQKTDDVFGVNAGLGPWTGDASSKAEVMDEIYRNRCIELFFSGMRLEDSRRIHSGFVPSNDIDTHSERNRNYYPYPAEERFNNTNIPPDPAI